MDAPTFVLGASGAISGISGCVAGMAYKAWREKGVLIARRIVILLFLAVIIQSVYDFFFLGASIWFHLFGFLIGLSAYMIPDLLKWSQKRLIPESLALVGISWAVFLLFAVVKVSADIHNKKPVLSQNAFMAGFISESVGERENAVKWYLQSAQQGNANAQAQIAYYYERGYSVGKDPEKAVYWLLKAARQNNVWDQAALAYHYYIGTGIHRDEKQAFYWCRKAALQHDPGSEIRLANFYLHGRGTPVNLSEAYYWDTTALKNPRLNESHYKMYLYTEIAALQARRRLIPRPQPHELRRNIEFRPDD